MKKTLAIFLEGIEEGLHPGGQITVLHNGQTVCDEAFGEARPGVPMTRESVQL